MSEQDSQSEKTQPQKVRKKFRKRWLLIPVALIAGAIFIAERYSLNWRGTLLSGQSETSVMRPAGTLEQAGEQDAPGFTTEDVLGTWVLDGAIRRVIENRPDGTATIDVTFDYFTALRYGSELQLDLEWTLKDDDVLTHKIVGGSPEKGKKRLISDFGEKAYFKILSITDEEMHLIDFDDPPEEYRWKRVDEKED